MINDKGKKQDIIICPGEEESDVEFDLDLDIDETIVQAIDGVLFKAEDDEVKLLFYYWKPDGVDVEEEVIKCKGFAEFRMSPTNFKQIVKYLNKKYDKIKRNKKINMEDIIDRYIEMYQ